MFEGDFSARTKSPWHHARDALLLPGCCRQMNVVGHQHVGVHFTAVAPDCSAEGVSIGPVVLIVCKARLAAMTVLHDVLWISGRFDMRKARHRPKLSKSLLRLQFSMTCVFGSGAARWVAGVSSGCTLDSND